MLSLMFSKRNIDEKILQRLRNNDTTLTSLDLNYKKISAAGASALAQALVNNFTLTMLDLQNNYIYEEGAAALGEALANNFTLTTLDLKNDFMNNAVIDGLTNRNWQYLKQLQRTVFNQLMVGRVLLYKAISIGNKNSSIILLPIEIREQIVKATDEKRFLTEEQQRSLLNYATGKTDEGGKLLISPVADKLSFLFKTKCDSIRKQIKMDEIEAASCSYISMI